MKSLVVCVDYADFLELTLPRNRKHFDRTLVVTVPDDRQTIALAKSFPLVDWLKTTAFNWYGSAFNKGLAIEIGLDALGRDGWIVLWDADIVMPEDTPQQLVNLEPGYLYGPSRRMLADWQSFRDGMNWSELPAGTPGDQHEWPGFFQCFHSEDPVLRSLPWYPIDCQTCAVDSFFHAKWPPEKKVRLPFDVLHLGSPGENWCGRVTPYADGSLPDGSDQHESHLAQIREKADILGADAHLLGRVSFGLSIGSDDTLSLESEELHERESND